MLPNESKAQLELFGLEPIAFG